MIDTLGALGRTVKRASGPSGVVLYLAHAHFEDAVGLEEFIESLRSDRRSLCVVGPEAAFERAWEDVVPGLDRWNLGSLPGVGSSPFEPDDPKRPYRGGDTAYPQAPYRFDRTTPWKTAFEPPEDVVSPWESKDPFEEALRRTEVAVPSSYGPFGLMRAAGATGGGYVLWGWAKGDAPVRVYDYGRCDLLPPDLRSRAQIAVDLDRRPVARALLSAWDLLEIAGIADTTPPWALGRPAAMRRSVGRDGFYLWGILEKSSERDDAVKSALAHRGRLDAVLSLLSDALTQAGDPKDDVDRRYRADAQLLQQALEAIRFRAQEYALWAQAIPKDAWRAGPKQTPWLRDETWIREGHEGEPSGSARVEPKDAQGGQRLLASRKDFLERFRGTPYAAIVAGNAVDTFRLDTIDMTQRGYGGPLPKSGKGSSTAPPPPPGGGSAGAPPPTTGK